MELAFLKYALIFCGVLLAAASLFVFIRLTNFRTWLKGNVPIIVLLAGCWFVLSGWRLMPLVGVVQGYPVMNASVNQLPDGQFSLVVDDGQIERKLVSHGDHFQTRVGMVDPGFIMRLLGMPEMVALDEVWIESSSFEQSIIANTKEVWTRDAGVIGNFSGLGVGHTSFLSRQLPLKSGALYSLVYRNNKLTWVAENKEAELALRP
jgi:hypothetical protein